MPDHLTEILPYLLFATGAGILGGVISTLWNPNVKACSAIQHFAAGAVLAAVATSVIPEAARVGTLPGVFSGFAAGGVAMIVLKWPSSYWHSNSLIRRRKRLHSHKLLIQKSPLKLTRGFWITLDDL